MDILVQILIGLGLATACGFRVFVPLWALSLFSMTGYIDLIDAFDWIGTMPAFIIFSVALVAETAVYYIPFLDNFMDTISTPVAVIASAVVMSSYIDGIDPLIKYTLLLIASSSLTLGVKSAMSGIRGMSSVFTGGLGNGFVTTGESIASIFFSVGVILFPILSVFIIVPFILFVRKKRKRKREKAIKNDAEM